MSTIETKIRKMGAEFALTSDLPNLEKEDFKFVNRCKEVGVDNDDRAVYSSDEYKTVFAASQLKKRFGLVEGSDFPPSVTINVVKGRVTVM